MKRQTMITLDFDLVTELKARRVNISKTCNDLLKQHVGMLQEEDPDASLNDKIISAEARLISLKNEKKDKEDKEKKRIEHLRKTGGFFSQ